MEWNLNIPKILHVYWGGTHLSYLRFLTVQSFMRHNPDWEVMFWYPEFPSEEMPWWTKEQKYETYHGDYLPKLMDLPITKSSIDFRHYKLKNEMSEVHKSDFLRSILLSTFGGLWSDMDILYFKPMTSLYFNTPENKDIETYICNSDYGHSVGFLMGSEKNQFFRAVFNLCKKHFNPKEYQTTGAMIYNRYFPHMEPITGLTSAFNLPMDIVYAYDSTTFPELLTNTEPKFTENSIGIHWYGGSSIWREFLNKTKGGLTNFPKNVIGNLIKEEVLSVYK